MYAHVSSPFDVVWPRFAATNPIVVYYNIVIMVLFIKKCPGGAWAGERVTRKRLWRHYGALCCNKL